jgi:hypothetical protein
MYQFKRFPFRKKICIISILLIEAFFFKTINCLATTSKVNQPVSITKNEQIELINKSSVDLLIKPPAQQTDNASNIQMPFPKEETNVSDSQASTQVDQSNGNNKPDKKMPCKKPPEKQEDNKKSKQANKIENKPVTIPPEVPRVRGYAFVEAVIQPLDYELNERFWGWRPNDIINVTDNVNNLQRGILEVIRRTVIVLANRISRTGSNDTLDENLENAMNWLMIKANQYWFPSPESKYSQAIDELRQYIDRLERGRALFYIRTDNLIPLLESYEDLLGGCDQSLTIKEDDDGPITSSKADNYFFYAQGVAKALGSIFRGVRKDFYVTLESVHGTQILDEAIEACDVATNIHPWLVTEGDLSSIFANHRANIDQPINRIRFYMHVLIKTLKGY